MEAFPGLGGSRSLGERLAYMANRIRPDRATRAQRLTRADGEAWSDAGWSRQSQWRRIGKFLKAPQARPSTLHAVRLALAEPA